MDSICLYKDKLNEALTLISSMSQPKKMEAVSYWNNAATYFQNIVNPPINNNLDQENPNETIIAQNLDTHVDVSLNASLSNSSAELESDFNSNSISMAVDILPTFNDLDISDSNAHFSSILESDPLFSLSRNISDDTEQAIPNVITSRVVANMNRQNTALFNAQVDYSDTSTDSGQGMSLSSLSNLEPVAQSTVLNPTNNQYIFPSRSGTLLSLSQDGNLTNGQAHQSECQPLTNMIEQAKSYSTNNASDGNNQNALVNTCYTKSNLDEVFQPSNNQQKHDINDGQFDRGPRIRMGNSQLVKSSTSPRSFPTANPYTNGNNPQASLSSQNQVCVPVEGIGNSSFCADSGCNNQGSLISASDLNRSQIVNFDSVSSLRPVLSTELVKCDGVCSQQTTEIPSNIYLNPNPTSDKNLHTCDICGKSGFSTKGNLKRHLKGHSGEKPFKCEYCEARFTEKKSLKVHHRHHTGEKPYQCNICHQRFAQTAVLKSHMMSLHLNERKFVCHKCNSAFKQSSQLKLHLMRHDGIKKLGCTECPARFLTKGDLERHHRVHTGERPYVCKLCNRAFTRQQSLNEHSNRHLGKKPYACKHCKKDFAEMSACYKHMKMHNEDDQQVIQSLKFDSLEPTNEQNQAACSYSHFQT